jgi:hypothetical protein
MDYYFFLCDSELRDEVFEKYDDEDYMSNNEDDNEGQEVTEPYDDDILEFENELSMNTIHDNIPNALVSGGYFVHGRVIM